MDWSNIPESIQSELAQLRRDNSELQAENEKLKRVAKAAKTIMHTADTKEDCPHGYNGKYPTSSWWCDDCFFELQEALASLMPGQP